MDSDKGHFLALDTFQRKVSERLAVREGTLSGVLKHNADNLEYFANALHAELSRYGALSRDDVRKRTGQLLQTLAMISESLGLHLGGLAAMQLDKLEASATRPLPMEVP